MSKLNFKEFVSELRSAVEKGDPYSFIRLGDGEAVVMGYPDFTELENLEKRLSKWFNTSEMSNDRKRGFSEGIRASCRAADMIGLPPSRNLQINVNWRNVEKYCKRYRLITDNHHTFNMDFVLDLQVKNMYKKIFKGLKEIYCITCRDVKQSIQEAFKIPNVGMFFIPPQVNPKKGLNHSPSRHYPNRFRDVPKWLDSIPAKGKVFLVGAGGAGKIYCDWVKGRGGIAFDIGSIFDGWAGLGTRTYIKDNAKAFIL